jgi:GH15 family glucan-1,4-alpha-glucosidase
MPRDVPVGNGSLLVSFDHQYQFRDLYWPHEGGENHTAGHPSRFGVWVDGQFTWVSDDGCERTLDLPEADGLEGEERRDGAHSAEGAV